MISWNNHYYQILDKDNKDMEILTDYETRTTIKLAEVLPNWWGNKRYDN